MKPFTLRELIANCVEYRDQMDERHHRFVDDMEKKWELYGEITVVSPRQMSYLRRLCAQYMPKPVADDKPKSKLQELREKRDKLRHAINRRAKREREHEMDSFGVASRLLAGELKVSDEPTAKIRHAKTAKELRKNDKLAVRYTKR